MQVPTIVPADLDTILNYAPPYAQIAKAMKAHGVSELGEMAYRDDPRFKTKSG